jgi:peptidoglycan hydrolase-like protein with peptidoglycan-binding domain
MSSVFALLATVGTVQAMETTTGDSMMKKDDAMMVKDDAMMVKDDAMTQKDTMMSASMDLMYGSRGEAVVTLQTFLESHSFLVIPVGVAKGYFGPLTQSALMKYQASVDVPSTGYYGSITRGVIERMMMKKDDAMMQKDEMMMKGDAMMEKKTQ